jgi:hypothetical protein
LVSYTLLPNGESFILSYYHGDWENRDLQSPKSEGSIFPDLLFSSHDPQNTGRPFRIIIGPAPKDGNELRVHELGGYKVNL